MGIREAYRTYLGRDASDDEVANWESGAYGYGNNPAAWVDAIRNSGEAQAYAAQSQGGGGGGNETQGGGGDGGGGEPEQGPTPTNTDPEPSPGTGGSSSTVDEAQDPALRAQVKTAYKTHLLRDASEAEVTAWLDGSNGWGKGKAGINRIIQGIANSGEAKAADPRYTAGANAATPGQAGRTAFQNIDWWARQGVNADDIKNADGTLKAGWENFSGGIRRAPGAANMGRLLGFDQTNYTYATSATPTMNSVKYGFAQIANRYPPTPTGLQQLLQDPEFRNRFPGAKLVGHDSIDFGNLLSDGATGTRVGIVDVGQLFDKNANTGNGWWWGPAGSGNTTTTTTSTTPTATTPAASAAATARGFTASGGGSPLMNPAATAGPRAMGMGGGGNDGMMYAGGPGGFNERTGQYENQSGITPYNPLANYNPETYNAPAPFMPPAYEGATPFARPEYAAAQPFTGLSVDEMNADPGYQFRMQQGQQALERSGAAKGVTNTGGNLRDILDYGQQAGSQEYGAAYGRKLNDYTTNEQNRFNTYQTNYANAMGAYNQNEANRAGAFDRNVGNAASAYNTNAENAYRQYTTNTAGQNMANQEAEARRSGAYNTNLAAYQNQQQYGLRSQAQAYDQQYRNWVEQYNQGRANAGDTYQRMYGLI